MNLLSKPLEISRKLHLLRIPEQLGLLPEGESCTLMAIREGNATEGQNGIRISELAARLGVSVPTVSRCLQKLTQEGYAQKSSREGDRRGTYVTLTPKGEEFCRQNLTVMSDFIKRAFSKIDEQELEQFFLTFDKVYDALSSELSANAKESHEKP